MPFFLIPTPSSIYLFVFLLLCVADVVVGVQGFFQPHSGEIVFPHHFQDRRCAGYTLYNQKGSYYNHEIEGTKK